jgi:hypothetical protein
MTSIKDITKKATDAYLAVWREYHTGWCPPPTDMKAKKWKQTLHQIWPEYTPVTINKSSSTFKERRAWCDEKPGSYWANETGTRWYFERRDMAALFKLTFEGI